MEIRVLGPLEVVKGKKNLALGGPKQRALLALLVAAAPKRVSADELIEGLWGEQASAGSRSTLQTYVSNLRRLIGDSLSHDRGGYRLDIRSDEVDASMFAGILQEARTRAATDPAGVGLRLREALALWRGRPYADLMDIPVLDSEIRRLEALRLEAVELRIDAELTSGRHAELVAELEALAEEYPTRERFRAQHMLALYRSGRQADALRAYRRTERYLAEELGVDPSEDLQGLELRILEHDDSLLAGSARAVTQRLAFLVTDIEASTHLWDRFPQSMASALATHDRIMRQEVEATGGRIFKHTGDGVLAVFPDAVAAVKTAEAVLARISEGEWGEIERLAVRIGIDVGEAEARGDDFFGPPLNRATRLCAIGHGGQVLVSSAAERDITAEAPAGLQVRHLGEVHLRGMATPERVAQMVFVGLPADFPDLRIDRGYDTDSRPEVMSLPGYEVRERIGEGAFGMVWRAYQPSVGRDVAVKIIRPDLSCQPSFVRRFEAEARTIGRLAHPHIVPLIDFWRDTASAYLVLGLLPGGSLADQARGGFIAPETGRRILGQIASALDHAHSQGVAHGDLKPANVLLDRAGNAYLSDFGIPARLLEPGVVHSMSAEPEFKAPEEAVTGPSPAADRFAFAVLASRLLDGMPELEPVLARGTARRPEDRYESATAFLDDLDSVLEIETRPEDRPAVTRNPYKGLRPFDEADAGDFYGRDDLISTVLTAVARHRFVTVVGPSGSGKSSVVRSGLIPALLSGRSEQSKEWLPVAFTPGSSPVQSLEQALTRVTGVTAEALDSPRGRLEAWADEAVRDGALLLVVDQLEELYTLVDDPAERDRFFDILLDAVSGPGRVHVVATLRADFYDRPLADPKIGKLVRDGQVTVLPATRDELIEMISAPAQAVGLRWEPGLPHRIAEDVAHQPGGLPLLQYALTELVERRSGDLLTDSDYSRIGEVSGALANRAETVYQRLAPSEQEVVRLLMVRLVSVDEESDDTRRRVRRSELESIGIPLGDLRAVIDIFTAERLLLADRDPIARTPTIEVAHEALLREWPRLRRWIDDQREGLVLGRRFRVALSEWEGNQRHDDYLLTGNRLSPFMGWAESSSLTQEEQAFYLASKREDERKRDIRRRRRRTLTGILGAAAAIAVVLGTIAVVQAQRASAEADAARANELSAFATAALDFDPRLAKLLAVTSAQVSEPGLDGISVLHEAFAADPVVDRYVWPDDREVGFMWTALSPDGGRLVAAGCGCATPSTYLEVKDLNSDEVLWSFDDVVNEEIVVDSPIFTPDGEAVVSGLYWLGEGEAEAGPLGAMVWDSETGELLETVDLGRCGGTVFGVSATHMLTDGITTESGGCFHQGMAAPAVMLIDRGSGSQKVLTESGGFMAMSGDGRYVAYGDRTAQPWLNVVEEVASGDRILELEVDSDQRVRALNDDGSLVVISVEDRLEVWDVASGEMITSFYGHAAEVWSVTFSKKGDGSIYSTGTTGSLLHWDASTGRQLASYPAVGNGNVSMAESGLVAVADQTARTASVIDTQPRGELWAVEAGSCDGNIEPASLQRGGNHATFAEFCLASGESNTVVVDLEAEEIAQVVEGGRRQAVSISPDGTRFARVDAGEGPTNSGAEEWSGPIRIRDVLTGSALIELEGLCTWDLNVVNAEGVGADLEGCAAYPETPFPIYATVIFWSDDGRRLAAADPLSSLIAVWDASSGELISGYEVCKPHPPAIYFDGDVIIVACNERDQGRVVFVDVDTGEEMRSIETGLFPSGDVAITGYTPDGSALVGLSGILGTGGGSLMWFDRETFEADVLPRIHEGAPSAFATSPSGELLATGSTDGFVKVWDVVERRQVHDFNIGEKEVRGVAFVDEDHLAVLDQSGLLSVYTLDVDELVRIVSESITREFTDTECERYGFGDECPTLDDLRPAGNRVGL